MTEDKPKEPSEAQGAEQGPMQGTPDVLSFQRSTVEGSLRQTLSPEERLDELEHRRDAGEISLYDFDLNVIYHLRNEQELLTRGELQSSKGEEAVVYSRERLEKVGGLDYVDPSRKRVHIDPERLTPGVVYVLFPEEVGYYDAVR